MRYKYMCDCCGFVEVENRRIDDRKIIKPCVHCVMDGLMQRVLEMPNTENIFIPDAFHSTASDTLPDQEHEKQAWREHAYKK